MTRNDNCVHSCHRGNMKPGAKTPEVRKKMSELEEREEKNFGSLI